MVNSSILTTPLRFEDATARNAFEYQEMGDEHAEPHSEQEEVIYIESQDEQSGRQNSTIKQATGNTPSNRISRSSGRSGPQFCIFRRPR